MIDDGDDLSLLDELDVKDSIKGWYFDRGKINVWVKVTMFLLARIKTLRSYID